jgi:alcohol dehydrogenase (cytochrome c)
MTWTWTGKVLPAVLVCLSPIYSKAQTLDPASLSKPATDTWPTYSGDYSGRRYSLLNQIDQGNVKNLALAWSSRVTAGSRGTADSPEVIVGGEGTAEATNLANIRGALLQVGGLIYVTTPDNAWALDARDGHEIWHYFWRTKGGIHIGNRGVGMWKDRVYMETPDNYLICLDAKTGEEIWHKEIANFNLQYFSTMAPIVIGNRLMVGTGDDLDEPGYLQAMDPETGELQWRFYTVPMKAGDPGLDTWANLDAATHGGGQCLGSRIVRP